MIMFNLLHRKFWFRLHCLVNFFAWKFVPPTLNKDIHYIQNYNYNNEHFLWRLNKYCANKWLKYYSVCGD